MKKLLVTFLAFVLFFGLVACDNTKEEQAEIEKIASQLVLEDETIEADTVLFNKAATLYDVTWELQENTNCELAVNDEGKQYIKILENYEWSDEIKLTATVHGVSEGVQAKKEFIIWARKIKAESLGIQAFYESKDVNVAVELTGTVYYVCPQGFWLTDDSGYTVYIYGTDAAAQVAAGDEVKVTGNKVLYYSMYEVETPSVEILNKGTGSYDLTSMITKNDVETISTYEKEFRHLYGRLYTIEGVVVEDPSGKYTYAIESAITGKYVVCYDSAMNDKTATQANLQENLGKYVKLNVMVWDHYSSGFVRILPISEAVETEMPELSDEQLIDKVSNEINLLNKDLASDVELPKGDDNVTVEWVSEKPEVLSAEGKIVSRGAEDVQVKLTATIKAGELTETVDVLFVVKAVELKTALQATKIALSGQTEYVKVEGKIIAYDTESKPYFYVADESGVTFVRTQLDTTQYAVGDVVSMIVKTTVYYNSNKEICPQLNVVTIEKIEKEVNVKEAETIDVSLITKKEHASLDNIIGENEIKVISSSSLYGNIVKVRVYVSVRTSGSYTNVYLAAENSADAPAGYYQHTSPLQDELKALDGKFVELVCPVYGYHAQYGWRLGTALSYIEVTE